MLSSGGECDANIN